MEDYSLIDAALDDVRNYMKTMDAEPGQLEIYLTPRFNEEGDAFEIHYTAQLSSGGDSPEDVKLEHAFRTEQAFEEVNAFEDLGYMEWIEQFAAELPEADLHYLPHPRESPLIEESIDCVNRFLEVFRESSENLSILMDPIYSDEEQKWYIDYSIRANIGSEENTYALDMSVPFEGTEEVFRKVYPVAAKSLREEYPEAEFYYPGPGEI